MTFSINAESAKTSLTGQALLEQPLLNRGTAFTDDQRSEFRLRGMLPPHEETIEEQLARSYEAYSAKDKDIERHIFLRQLQDENEVLFNRLVLDHIAEMTPMIYTPVVGQACQQFSHIYRRPRGLFISWPERDRIEEILRNAPTPRVDVIVVTDGERILGLGDQGAGGMAIPIGKLSLYTICGGIHPAGTLPILLDLGTNNQERLADPRYIGWRHERIKGKQYDEFIDAFVAAVMRVYSDVLLQWEDFATPDANAILNRHRDRLCTFNDDIQGTAAVTTATILAAIKVAGDAPSDQRFVMLGAGSAGCGVSEQLVKALVADGMTEADARGRFYLVDLNGLLHDGRSDLADYQQPLAQNEAVTADWDSTSFEDVVKNVHPTVLIGATGHGGSFTEPVIRDMAAHSKRPIIFPLSNPTSRAEATPEQLFAWTDGQAIVATGSPFDPVEYNGTKTSIAQCNNSYIFPAMGLGIRAVAAQRVSDKMFMAAALALRDVSPALADPTAPLLPPLADIRNAARAIAIAVGGKAQEQGLAKESGDVAALVDRTMWTPDYPELKAASER